MKTKKNKKFYNFTEKQKRKKRSRGWQGWMDTPAPYFRKMFNDEYNAKCKQVLYKILNGKEIEFPKNVRNIRWYWW